MGLGEKQFGVKHFLTAAEAEAANLRDNNNDKPFERKRG
jgi:hypothetical protein